MAAAPRRQWAASTGFNGDCIEQLLRCYTQRLEMFPDAGTMAANPNGPLPPATTLFLLEPLCVFAGTSYFFATIAHWELFLLTLFCWNQL